MGNLRLGIRNDDKEATRMARPHKKAGAAMSVQTKLAGNQLQTICHDAAEATKKLGSKITVSGQTPERMTFNVSATLDGTQNSFAVNILDRGEMRGMSSELLQYKTSQQTVMFIPVTPKSLKGHSLYMAFLERVVAAVKQADPQAETSIRDR